MPVLRQVCLKSSSGHSRMRNSPGRMFRPSQTSRSPKASKAAVPRQTPFFPRPLMPQESPQTPWNWFASVRRHQLPAEFPLPVHLTMPRPACLADSSLPTTKTCSSLSIETCRMNTLWSSTYRTGKSQPLPSRKQSLQNAGRRSPQHLRRHEPETYLPHSTQTAAVSANLSALEQPLPTVH